MEKPLAAEPNSEVVLGAVASWNPTFAGKDTGGDLDIDELLGVMAVAVVSCEGAVRPMKAKGLN